MWYAYFYARKAQVSVGEHIAEPCQWTCIPIYPDGALSHQCECVHRTVVLTVNQSRLLSYEILQTKCAGCKTATESNTKCNSSEQLH